MGSLDHTTRAGCARTRGSLDAGRGRLAQRWALSRGHSPWPPVASADSCRWRSPGSALPRPRRTKDCWNSSPLVTRTFLDAGVLIAAARGRGIIAVRAHTILDDPGRNFVASDYLRMEVLPKALYHRQNAEVLLYERFFLRAVQIVPPSVSLMMA